MSLRLAASPALYARGLFDSWRARLEEADKENHKRGQDIEVGQTRDGDGGLVSARLVLRDRVSGQRFAVVIDGGVLGLELLP
jgi:hypothetical protein